MQEAKDLVPEELFGGGGLAHGTGTHWSEPVQPPRVKRAWTWGWR